MQIAFKKLTNIVPALRNTFARFPLPVLFILCATTVALILVHNIQLLERAALGKLFAAMAYSAVSLTSLKLVAERHGWSAVRHAAGVIVTLSVIAIYVLTVLDEQISSTYLFFSLATVLSLLFAPYIKTASTSSSVWYFNYQTGAGVFFGGLAALVLGIGMVLSLVSIGYLFEIKVPGKLYGDIWLLCWLLLFPVYVLSSISREFDFEDEGCAFPGGVSFITNYILVPLMFAYMAILYVYLGKILIQQELPRGNLGWMITAFGTIGITTKLLAYPIRHKGTRLLSLFDSYYYYALLVPIILLGIAIGVRINDYGVTEQRYAVVLLGAWFALVALGTIVLKQRFHIRYVPVVLAVMALFASFGPWGAVELSIQSQLSRFESLLNKHQLLVDGRVVRSQGNIPFADRKSISSIADYLTMNEDRLRHIQTWFEPLAAESGDIEIKAKRWSGGRTLVELLGLKYVNRWQKEKGSADSYYNYKIEKGLFNVSGYDFVVRGSLYSHKPGKTAAREMFDYFRNGRQGGLTVEFNGKSLVIRPSPAEEMTFNVTALVRKLRKQKLSKIPLANQGMLSLSGKSAGGMQVKILFENIYGHVIEGGQFNTTSVHYVLMIRFQ